MAAYIKRKYLLLLSVLLELILMSGNTHAVSFLRKLCCCFKRSHSMTIAPYLSDPILKREGTGPTPTREFTPKAIPRTEERECSACILEVTKKRLTEHHRKFVHTEHCLLHWTHFLCLKEHQRSADGEHKDTCPGCIRESYERYFNFDRR